MNKHKDFICIHGEGNTTGDELEAWFENHLRSEFPEDWKLPLRYPVNYCVTVLNWDYDIFITSIPNDMWSAVNARKTQAHGHREEAQATEGSDICIKCGELARSFKENCPTTTEETPQGKRRCVAKRYDIEVELENACDECDDNGYLTVWEARVECDIIEHGFLAIYRYAVENLEVII